MHTVIIQYIRPNGRKQELPLEIDDKYEEADKKVHECGANYSVETVFGMLSVYIEHCRLGVDLSMRLSTKKSAGQLVEEMLEDKQWVLRYDKAEAEQQRLDEEQGEPVEDQSWVTYLT